MIHLFKKNYFKSIILLTFISPLIIFGQVNKKEILKSTDIKEIEQYLVEAHPDDPKRIILKKKLVMLKNADWVKGAKTAKPMEARKLEDSVLIAENNNFLETNEFNRLIAENSSQHNEKTVRTLNTIFDQDPNAKDAIILIKNNSNCNIIIRIQGHKEYRLPIYKNSNDTIVLQKGEYTFKSNICGSNYNVKKNIMNNFEVNLSNSYSNTRIAKN